MQHSQPTLAIILATYNPDLNFFRQQILSIQKQSFSSWRCYIVDDASSEESQKDIQNFVVNDKRFEIHFFKENKGPFYNFERGLQLAAADEHIQFIALCDQDDIWEANKLTVQLESLELSEIKLSHSDLVLIDSQNNIIASSTWRNEQRQIDRLTSQDIIFRNIVTGCSTVFKKEILNWALPFPDNNKQLYFHHDQWLALAALQQGKIISISSALIQYRQHEKNVVGAKKRGSFLNNLFPQLIFRKACVFYESRNFLLQEFLKRNLTPAKPYSAPWSRWSGSGQDFATLMMIELGRWVYNFFGKIKHQNHVDKNSNRPSNRST